MTTSKDSRARPSGPRRVAWFVGLWLASLAGFASIVYGARAVLEAVL